MTADLDFEPTYVTSVSRARRIAARRYVQEKGRTGELDRLWVIAIHYSCSGSPGASWYFFKRLRRRNALEARLQRRREEKRLKRNFTAEQRRALRAPVEPCFDDGGPS